MGTLRSRWACHFSVVLIWGQSSEMFTIHVAVMISWLVHDKRWWH